MRSKVNLCLIFLFLLFSSCQSINHSRTDIGIPAFSVLFSFDDGPNGETTKQLLDVLKKYQVKAIFSLLGENAERYPDIVKRIYDEGHYIANHGYSDKWAYRMNDEEFRNNLIRADEIFSSIIGRELKPKLYRPHGGYYKSRQERIFTGEGFSLVPGSIRIYDATLKEKDKQKAFKKIIEKIEKEKGGIILLHDGRDSHLRMERELEKKPDGAFNCSWIPGFVEEVIIELLSKGYDLNGGFHRMSE